MGRGRKVTPKTISFDTFIRNAYLKAKLELRHICIVERFSFLTGFVIRMASTIRAKSTSLDQEDVLAYDTLRTRQ